MQINGPVFRQQGGGVTSHVGCQTYVDLIVGELDSTARNNAQIVHLFKTFALYKQGESNFGYAELHKDLRLRDALSKTESGKILYAELSAKIPLLSLSNDILGNPNNTKNVTIFPLNELNDNPLDTLNKLYEAAKNKSVPTDRYVIKKIDNLRKIFSEAPESFGISFIANTAVKEWVDKKRSRSMK